MSVPASPKRSACFAGSICATNGVRRFNPEGEDYLQCRPRAKISMTSSGPIRFHQSSWRRVAAAAGAPYERTAADQWEDQCVD
jgi:hypothetical protein